MGWDMRSGLAAAQGDYLVVIDGDAQNPVEDLVKMYREMKATGADVMKGRRIARFDGPYRRVVSGVFNALFMVVFRTHGLWDINGKPKGMTRRAYEQLQLTSDDWFIDAEIMISARRLGFEVAEMPVVFRRNDERASFVRVSAISEFLGKHGPRAVCVVADRVPRRPAHRRSRRHRPRTRARAARERLARPLPDPPSACTRRRRGRHGRLRRFGEPRAGGRRGGRDPAPRSAHACEAKADYAEANVEGTRRLLGAAARGRRALRAGQHARHRRCRRRV